MVSRAKKIDRKAVSFDIGYWTFDILRFSFFRR